MKLYKGFYLFFLVLLISGIVQSIILANASNLQTKFILIIVLKLFLIALTYHLALKINLFKKIKTHTHNFMLIPVFIILSILAYLDISREIQYTVSEKNHFLFFILCMSIGFFEEFFFRFLIFQFIYTRKKKIMISIIITSLLFGLAHLGNLFNPLYDKLGVINQVFLAFYLGILLQSILIRFNNIYLVIFLHAMINYFGSYQSILLEGQKKINQDFITFSDVIETITLSTIIGALIILPLSYLLIEKKLKLNSRLYFRKK